MEYNVIAVDFDGTICTENFPEIGQLIVAAKRTLKRFKAKGGHIIIWTCRSGQDLQEAIDFLHEYHVPYDTINENLPYRIKQYKADPRKVGADMYIDDRNPGGVDWNLIAKLLEVDEI